MAGMWKSLVYWDGKSIEWGKQSLTGHCNGSLDNKNAEKNVDNRDLTCKVSEGNKDY